VEAVDNIAKLDGDNEHKCRQMLFMWLDTHANLTYTTLMKAVKCTASSHTSQTVLQQQDDDEESLNEDQCTSMNYDRFKCIREF